VEWFEGDGQVFGVMIHFRVGMFELSLVDDWRSGGGAKGGYVDELVGCANRYQKRRMTETGPNKRT